MKREKVVFSWKLCEGDIEDVCEKNVIDYNKLTKKEKENIVHYFRAGFDALVDAWEDILRDAILEVKEGDYEL